LLRVEAEGGRGATHGASFRGPGERAGRREIAGPPDFAPLPESPVMRAGASIAEPNSC